MIESKPQNRPLGYARVSTYWQTLDSQLEQLRAAECSTRNIYRELNRTLGKLAPGDVVTVTRIEQTRPQHL